MSEAKRSRKICSCFFAEFKVTENGVPPERCISDATRHLRATNTGKITSKANYVGWEMDFWSKLWRRREEFVFSDAPPSQYIREALQEAENRPLDDLTWRIVIASQKRHWIIDITLFQADAGFTAYARGGIQKARLNAASIIMDAIKGLPVDDATMASASLAFFDTNFTVGANKGKTRETAWNTLALDAECKNGRLQVTRSAHRLTFPFGPLLLDYVEVLNRFTGGMK